jgi:Flp pilus assembly pilin Flp
MRIVPRLLKDDRGVGAIEYALIASLISVAAIGAFHTLGSQVGGKFSKVDQVLSNAV